MKNVIGIIGDIHGCFNTLHKLYNLLAKNCKEIYSVGDIIDRGNYSKETVEFCIKNSIISVRGNHEDMLLKAIEHPGLEIYKGFGTFLELYYSNGGGMTQKSYINSTREKDFMKFADSIRKLNHLEYLQSFPLIFEFEKVIISHAGVIKGGDPMSVLWNRDIPSDMGKLQVFGHTPQTRINFNKGHFINIDTGCVYGDSLSAILVNTNTGEVSKAYSEDVDEKDIY